MAWVWAEMKGSVFLLILRLNNNESAYLHATVHSQTVIPHTEIKIRLKITLKNILKIVTLKLPLPNGKS